MSPLGRNLTVWNLFQEDLETFFSAVLLQFHRGANYITSERHAGIRTSYLKGICLRDSSAGFSMMKIQCGCFARVNVIIRTKCMKTSSCSFASDEIENLPLETTL